MADGHDTQRFQFASQDGLLEALAYHDVERSGFVSLMLRGTKLVHRHFRLAEIPQRLKHQCEQPVEAYLTQNEFHRPSRRVVDCARLTSCYLDLDTYKSEHLQGRPPEFLVEAALLKLQDEALPEPSQIVFSGRGLQVKWVFEHPIAADSLLPTWQAVQSELCRRMNALCADPAALDAARVLRLVGTVNARSGEVVRLVHRARTPAMGASMRADGLIVYPFDEFANTVLSFLPAAQARQCADARNKSAANMSQDLKPLGAKSTSPSPEAESGQRLEGVRHPGARALNAATLAWHRLGDLRLLAQHRGWTDGAPEGRRNELIFLGACFLSQAGVAGRLSREVLCLAREFAPTWSDHELLSCITSVLARDKRAAAGERALQDGKWTDPRYRFKNETLIQRLQITAEEQRKLKCIVGEDEARRRDRARKERQRRARGVPTRDEYLKPTHARREAARQLHADGRTVTQIAAELGVSKSMASRYCSEMSLDGRGPADAGGSDEQ